MCHRENCRCISYGKNLEELKWFYYRGLQEWDRTHNYLVDTCLTAQDKFKLILEYFKITF